MPSPWSRTVRPRLSRPSTSTGPPWPACSAALSSRLLIARIRRSGLPLDRRPAAGPRRTPHAARCGGRGPGPPRRAGQDACPRCSSGGVSPRATSIRSETSRSAPRSARRRPSAGGRGPLPPARAPESSTSMLVRRLVTGVRSSCEASATSWRWAVTEASSCGARALEPFEHLVEARAPAGRPRRPRWTVDPLAEIVGLADQLGGGGDLGQRLQHPARGHACQAARPGRPPARNTSASSQRSVRRTLSTRVQRAARAGSATAVWPERVVGVMPKSVHPQMRAVDMDVAERGPAAVPAATLVARCQNPGGVRERATAGGARRAPVREHDLLIGRRAARPAARRRAVAERG